MKNIKDHFTKELFDPWMQMGKKRKKLLEEGWPGVFREVVFPNLPVDEVGKHFDENMGRPSTELYTFTGLPVLQQMLDLTDKELQQALAFDARFHYALDIKAGTDRNTYVSLKTIWTARDVLVKEGLQDEIFQECTEELLEAFGADTDNQRIDSSRIRSDMKEMGRVRMLSATIEKFLRELEREKPGRYREEVPEELRDKYGEKESQTAFSEKVKPSDARKKGAEVAGDLYSLYLAFKEEKQINRLESFELIERVIEEQCEIVEGEEEETIELVEAGEVEADSLQNPSDPDAAYDGHKGKGYLVQLMETYQPEQDGKDPLQNGPPSEEEQPNGPDQNPPEEKPEEKASSKTGDSKRGEGQQQEKSSGKDRKGSREKQDSDSAGEQKQPGEEQTGKEAGGSPNFLTYLKVEPINRTDEEALPEALDEVTTGGDRPRRLLGDTRYGSDENRRRAQEEGTRLVSPMAGKRPEEEKLHRSDFKWEGKHIKECPEGNRPEQIRETGKGNNVAEYSSGDCGGCDQKELCPTGEEAGGYRLRYTPKQSRDARRRTYEQTEAFSEEYRWRAGIESTASQYKRRLRDGKIPYRGLEKMEFSGVIKGLAVNLFRAVKAIKEGGVNPFQEERTNPAPI